MRILTKYGVNDPEIQNDGKYYMEIACNSDETKPISMVAGGSIALETDTLDLYTFDERSETWMLTRNLSGGGGGSDEPFVVQLTPTALDYSGTMDKTAEEITAAIDAKKQIVFSIDGSSSGFDAILVNADTYSKLSGTDNYAAQGSIIMLPSTLIRIVTSDATEGTDYYTYLYDLPAAQ